MKTAYVGITTAFPVLTLVSLLALSSAGCGGGTSGEPAAPGGSGGGLVVPERAGKFEDATQFYGPLVVREGDIEAESQSRPWSSYWYPINDAILVKPSDRNGNHATLDKFDKYAKSVLSQNVTSVDEEIKRRYYNPMAQNWEGRCGAWAVASVMEPEPAIPDSGIKLPGTDLTFFTRDVKALVIKSYETVDNSAFHRFGQPFQDGNGGEFQDMYPDQFHRVVQAELFDQGRAFIMDDTAGVEVWNSPIWYANLTMTRDAADPHVMHVFARLKGAKSTGIDPSYSRLSKPKPGAPPVITTMTYRYTYDLYGVPQDDGSLLVKYGKWTNGVEGDVDSVKEHPDFVLTLPEPGVKIRHASENSQLKQEILDDLLIKTRAFQVPREDSFLGFDLF